jgi:hypothetical protein
MQKNFTCYSSCGDYKLFSCTEAYNKILVKNSDYVESKIQSLEVVGEELNTEVSKTIRAYFEKDNTNFDLSVDSNVKDAFLSDMHEIYKYHLES